MPIAPEYLHLVYPGPFPAFLYGRNSKGKKARSVGDQLTEGTELCTAHGWPIAGVFKDPDRSASRHAKKARDDFESMLEEIAAGKCRILIAFEASRYYRDLEVYVRLRNACAAAGVLLCYNGTIYDLSKREDRKATAMDAIAAEDEAEGIRDRNLRTMRRNAEARRPHGRIPYGYARRYDPDSGELLEQYPHPAYGTVITEIFTRIAAYETGYSIIKDLNERGDTGREWTLCHLSDLLRCATYAGRRIHQGKDIGKANWEALVDEETWLAVQQIVNSPGRNSADDRTIKHLQSGLARCGECPEEPPLKPIKNRGYPSYQCPDRFDTNMLEDKMDAYVEEGVIAWLSSPAAAAAFRSEQSDAAAAKMRLQVDQLNAQLAEAREAAARFTADGKPELSIASLAALEARLSPLIEKAQAQIESAAVPPLLRSLVGQPNVEEIWHSLTLSQQRSVLKRIVTIRLFKARARGVRRIEPGRITLSFVGQPGFVSG